MIAAPARRRFLVRAAIAGGGLLLGYALGRPRDLLGDPATLPVAGGEIALNAWVKIGTDDTVTIAIPRAEMGQGVHTSLAMILADELDADWSQVRVTPAPVAAVYGNVVAFTEIVPWDDRRAGYGALRWIYARFGQALGIQLTGSSTSVRDAWEPMRTAGAAARDLLRQAAAREFGVRVHTVTVRAGEVLHAESGRRRRFGALAAVAAGFTPRPRMRLKAPHEFTLIGFPLPRLDVPVKTDGSARFGIDHVEPGMLFAAIRAAPVFGARLDTVDEARLRAAPGVHGLVRLPDALAVVARTGWHAERALALTPPTFVPARSEASAAALDARFEVAFDAGDFFTYERRGDGAAALGTPTVQAEYRVPLLAHACLEPLNCTAKVTPGRVDLWLGTQAPDLVQRHAARALGVPEVQVHVHPQYLGGGFGRRAEPDVALQAIAVARAFPGRAVKLVWSRAEDLQHDVYRPPGHARMAARLDTEGRIAAWVHRGVSPDVSPRFIGRLVPALPVVGPDRTSVDGAVFLRYTLPHAAVSHCAVPVDPLPIGIWRSVGHSMNTFFVESFIDELAAHAHADPFEFRLRHLAGARERTVLERLRQRCGWDTPAPAGRARGVAFSHVYESLVAQVAEVSAGPDGAPRVHRVWCVVDCGTVVNPDTVQAQMEGGILFGLSAALWGKVPYADGRIGLASFADCRLVTLADTPDIDVAIVGGDAPPGGIGESGTPAIAPAIANAWAALTGERRRALPLALADPMH
ncbi:MAG: molybdopterin cofactor-binding domain-containing protein [Gammaproteobacteria bacterium]